MKTTVLLFASAGLVASLLAAGPVLAEGGASRASSDSCRRAALLEAAQEALARGDRALALEHLRRAEANLDTCFSPAEAAPREGAPPAEGALPAESIERAEAALAFGVKTHPTGPLS